MKTIPDDMDRRAIDLLLDRKTSGQLNEVFAVPVREQFEKRLDAVEQVLSLLDQLPEFDPPEDLASRTLDRIANSESEPMHAPRPHFADTRPHA
ncbi:MAG TPA: hypothetical protein VL282_11745 [Tepidisphaeraceae bacterium]|jgi:hypothetical protein|nr:hypothetical protein [Tepidisphaeraceae bacterium]